MTTPYGSVVLEHFRRPRNHRALVRPSAAHESYNPLCGDRVRVEIDVHDGVMRDVAFTANACAICTASASLLTERVRGVALAAISAITDDAVIVALDSPIPEARAACAVLPLQALRGALGGLPSV
jgi:nitrogen fixation protein NifU and related proteins